MIAQHEQQHDETMLITHQLRRGPPALHRARPGAGRRCSPARPKSSSPAARSPWAPPPSRGRWTTNGPRTGGVVPRLLHRHHAGDQRRLPGASSRTAATTTRAGGPPEGWAHIRQHGIARAAVLAARRRAVAAPPVRGDRAGAAGRAGAARELVRGRRLRPLGRTAAAHRGRVGEGRPARPGTGGRSRATRGATTTPRPTHANLGQRHLRPAPAGSYPDGAVAARRTAVDRRRVGVDGERLPAVPGVRRLPVPGVLGGVLRRRVQGAARRFVRRRRGGLPGHVPQLGPTRSGGRSSPGSAPPGTPTREAV